MKENMKNYISALLIAIGLVGLGLCVKSGLNSFNDRNRVVTVRGLAEREVAANKVTWPISYTIVGNDLSSMYAEMESKNLEVINYLTTKGLKENEYNVAAPKVEDLQADRYNNNVLRYRYNLTSNITVTSEQVDLVRKLINEQGELIKKGIAISPQNWNNQIIYEYTELNSIKPDMIAEATRNAREAADRFASDSGSKVGKIKDAQQGQFSIEDRDPYTPFIKKVRVVTYVNFYIKD